MIRQIVDSQKLEQIPLPNEHHARKISTLYDAYGIGNSFCRFYTICGNDINAKEDDFSSLYGIAVVMGELMILSTLQDIADIPEQINEELCAFIFASEFEEIGMNHDYADLLKDKLGWRYNYSYSDIHRYNGELPKREIRPKIKPHLEQVYKIVSSSFDDILYEAWYVDMSHRIRHGISKVYTYKDSATLTVQYDVDGNIFISHVATLPKMRGRGYSTKLLQTIAYKYHSEGKIVELAAEKDMREFYKKIGFSIMGECAHLKLKR